MRQAPAYTYFELEPGMERRIKLLPVTPEFIVALSSRLLGVPLTVEIEADPLPLDAQCCGMQVDPIRCVAHIYVYSEEYPVLDVNTPIFLGPVLPPPQFKKLERTA